MLSFRIDHEMIKGLIERESVDSQIIRWRKLRDYLCDSGVRALRRGTREELFIIVFHLVSFLLDVVFILFRLHSHHIIYYRRWLPTVLSRDTNSRESFKRRSPLLRKRDYRNS